MDRSREMDNFCRALLNDLTTADGLIISRVIDIRITGFSIKYGTILQFAIAHGNLHAARFLLDKGASLKPTRVDGCTLLEAIRDWQHGGDCGNLWYIISKLLLEKSAGCSVRVHGYDGDTVTKLFLLVLKFRSLRCMQLLLTYGANFSVSQVLVGAGIEN